MLTQQRLKELLHYDHETGVFTWLVDRRGCKKKAGEEAGTLSYANPKRKDKKRVIIRIDGEDVKAHNLAWLYAHGVLYPKDGKMIDHEDLDATNNRLSNLRVCTKNQNMGNMEAYPRNKLGKKNISKTRFGTFKVEITKNKIKEYDKTFKTLAEAEEARDREHARVFGQFTR